MILSVILVNKNTFRTKGAISKRSERFLFSDDKLNSQQRILLETSTINFSLPTRDGTTDEESENGHMPR